MEVKKKHEKVSVQESLKHFFSFDFLNKLAYLGRTVKHKKETNSY